MNHQTMLSLADLKAMLVFMLVLCGVSAFNHSIADIFRVVLALMSLVSVWRIVDLKLWAEAALMLMLGVIYGGFLLSGLEIEWFLFNVPMAVLGVLFYGELNNYSNKE